MLSREQIECLLDSMIQHQRKKVMEIARKLVPGVTEEDVRNSYDFPELASSQQFNFEDGILSGYISAKIAMLAEIRNISADNELTLE